jgi:hypothetical protein
VRAAVAGGDREASEDQSVDQRHDQLSRPIVAQGLSNLSPNRGGRSAGMSLLLGPRLDPIFEREIADLDFVWWFKRAPETRNPAFAGLPRRWS